MKHIDPKYLDLIILKITGEISEEQERQLNAWLDQSPENRKFFDDFVASFSGMEEMSSSDFEVDTDQEWQRFKDRAGWNEKPHTRIIDFNFRGVWQYAAAAIVLLFFAFFIFIRPEKKYVARGGNITVVLPDSSVVKLRENSKLVLKRGFAAKNRMLRLYGQAYFVVRHNTSLPFVVKTDGFSVQVVGTEFLVSQKDKSVVVNRGIVRVNARGKDALLRSGEKAIVTSHSIRVKVATDKNIMAWATGKLVFDNTPLEKVFADIESNFGVKVVVTNPRIKNYRLTAVFTNQSVEQILQVIAQTEGIEIVKQGPEEYIAK